MSDNGDAPQDDIQAQLVAEIPPEELPTADVPDALPGAILTVRDLVKTFPVRGSGGKFVVQAVSGVSFDLRPGQTLGLVGESGSGKSTVGRCILRLLEPTAGEVVFDGVDVRKMSEKALRKYRGNMQIVFQDPYASLDPRMTVAAIVAEPLNIHRIKIDRKAKVRELLQLVGLNPEHGARYPHEFSGGQRQRIGIARAIALEPRMLVLDEPVSALDVSIQAGVVNLLEDLQDRLGLAYLFIAHDLSVVRHTSDEIAVMYLGKIVEKGPAERIYLHAQHPYTQALLSAVPVADPALERGRTRHHVAGRRSEPGEPAFRLPVPHAVLEGARDLRARRTRIDRPRRRPSGCVSLRGREVAGLGRNTRDRLALAHDIALRHELFDVLPVGVVVES